MSKLTRAAFEARLRELGYADIAPFEYDACPHPKGKRWAFYFMPDASIAPDDPPPANYGDLGWQLYEGCKACIMEGAEAIWHGGMYEHLRIFGGEVDQTGTVNLVVSEIQRAEEPLPQRPMG